MLCWTYEVTPHAQAPPTSAAATRLAHFVRRNSSDSLEGKWKWCFKKCIEKEMKTVWFPNRAHRAITIIIFRQIWLEKLSHSCCTICRLASCRIRNESLSEWTEPKNLESVLRDLFKTLTTQRFTLFLTWGAACREFVRLIKDAEKLLIWWLICVS